MQPFLSTKALAHQKRECADAWELAKSATGSKKLALIAKAFPHSISPSKADAKGFIRVHYSHKYSSFMVSDYKGFLTMIPHEDIRGLILAIGSEANELGSYRQSITGERPPPLQQMKEDKAKTRRLTLADIGMGQN